MPWLETVPVEQRARFIDDHRLALYDMTELCARYAISRKTGYKWLARYDAGGRRAAGPESRAAHMSAQDRGAGRGSFSWRRVASIPTGDRRSSCSGWSRGIPPSRWPAISTAGDLLARRGLVQKRRRRRPHPTPRCRAADHHAPNNLWTTDFKGQFRTRDRIYCYRSRSPTSTRATCSPATACARRGHRRATLFERLFREYGLPRAMRTDNGVPFASTVAARPHGAQCLVDASRHSAPADSAAHPQQNGAHERMHKTLKRGAIRPPRAKLAAQQRRSIASGSEYNEERPHQPCDGDAKLALSPLARRTPARCPPSSTPSHFLVKRVTTAGTFRFKNRLFYITNGPANTASASKRSLTASGRCTSATSCSPGSTNESAQKEQLGVTHVPG